MFARTLVGLLAFICTVAAVWPAPKEITTGEDVLFMHPSLEIISNGASICFGSPKHDCICQTWDAETFFSPQVVYSYGYTPSRPKCHDSEIVEGGISRAMKAIFQQSFVPWRLRPRGSDFEPDVHGNKTYVTMLVITYAASNTSECYKPVADEVDESYTLDLQSNGKAKITAGSAVGVLRALESFVQLFYKHSSGSNIYTTLAPVHIKDMPKFPHRGVMMDVARHFFPLPDIYRTIDAMSWNKMNRLHIHMTDSQSWPLVIPALPKLAEKGAYAKGLWYTSRDLQAIFEYGAYRGVEVIVEVDMPGHIGSVALAYPELIVAYNKHPYHSWCLQPPCGAFKMNSTDVYAFLGTLFDDLLPRITPYSAYFHTGGDELYPNDTTLDEGIRSNETAIIKPYLQKFLNFVFDEIRNRGLKPVMWQDNLLDKQWAMEVGKDVLIQTWLGGESVKNATKMGYKVIDSDSSFWYLDCGSGHWMDFDSTSFAAFYPFNDWCSPTKNWRLIYSHDPTAGLTENEAKNVLGGEVAVWSESIDPVNLDSLIWPRASAAGEVLWSGRVDEATGQNRSQIDASMRLADLRERMVARGVRASPVQMIFCTQAENPEECAHVI